MTQLAERPGTETQRPVVINDFTINVATVNGSGSQTANATIVNALFHMGIPVNAKNLFPSNIKGLPTWYNIRASKDGFVARRDVTEVLVAFNAKTIQQDLAELPAGGVIFYPDHLKFEQNRGDVSYYALPANTIMKQHNVDAKFRDRMINMVYVGGLAQLLGLEMQEVLNYLNKTFGGRAKLVDPNFKIAKSAFEHCEQNIQKSDPYRLERMDGNKDMIMVDGNTAGALGSIYGGVGVVAWYPITPATSLADGLTDYLPRLRKDPANGQATFAIVQAEDELAAIGMLVGAGWAGARAMTSTSGPGISLMAELAGYAYFAEIPLVIWNVQRMGPSTGLPTRVSQGDLLATYYLSHGDTKHVVLLPKDPKECFEFGWRSFDIADQLQTPVFVNSDLDIGMNLWMSEKFEYPSEPMKRGKVLSAEDVKALGNTFARYRDEDGSGVGPRTLPGTDAMGAAYFTRGTGHTDAATYSERPGDWQQNLQRIDRKHEHARTLVPAPEIHGSGAKLGVIAMGSADPAILEGRVILKQHGLETDYMRVRALPFSQEVRDFIAAHDEVVVVELNQHGQLAILLRTEYPEFATRTKSIAHCDGLPLSGEFVAKSITKSQQVSLKTATSEVK